MDEKHFILECEDFNRKMILKVNFPKTHLWNIRYTEWDEFSKAEYYITKTRIVVKVNTKPDKYKFTIISKKAKDILLTFPADKFRIIHAAWFEKTWIDDDTFEEVVETKDYLLDFYAKKIKEIVSYETGRMVGYIAEVIK